MGIKERREREKGQIKGMIMKTVNTILAEEGWEAVTIRRIADEIEYSPPIIYEHYGNKDVLLLELTKEAYQKLLKTFLKFEKEEHTPSDALVKIAVAYYDFCLSNKGYCKAIMGLDGVPANVHIDLEEWREIEGLLHKIVSKILGVNDPQAPVVVDSVITLLWILRGGISAGVIGDTAIAESSNAIDKQRMANLLKYSVETLARGWRQQQPTTAVPITL